MSEKSKCAGEVHCLSGSALLKKQSKFPSGSGRGVILINVLNPPRTAIDHKSTDISFLYGSLSSANFLLKRLLPQRLQY